MQSTEPQIFYINTKTPEMARFLPNIFYFALLSCPFTNLIWTIFRSSILISVSSLSPSYSTVTRNIGLKYSQANSNAFVIYNWSLIAAKEILIIWINFEVVWCSLAILHQMKLVLNYAIHIQHFLLLCLRSVLTARATLSSIYTLLPYHKTTHQLNCRHVKV